MNAFIGMSFKTTFGAIMELVVLGAVGYWMIRRSIVSDQGLRALSDLVIDLFLPCLMFSQIISKFSFSAYPEWWIFPLLSILVTGSGYLLGILALGVGGKSLGQDRREFLGVVSFQNSGYLPIPLVAALLAPEAASQMFIYIFLFLLGFNMTIFSIGVILLSPKRNEESFKIRRVLNPPVVATTLALLVVFFRAQHLLPGFVSQPIEVLGTAAIPLSLLVVGGNLAALGRNGSLRFKPIGIALFLKLIMLPAIFLFVLTALKIRPSVGFLLILQAAMPPAALLSVISKSQNSSDHLVSASIFYGHLLSIVTIPLFLALFNFFAR